MGSAFAQRNEQNGNGGVAEHMMADATDDTLDFKIRGILFSNDDRRAFGGVFEKWPRHSSRQANAAV